MEKAAKWGFIGFGNMAQAMAKGLLAAGAVAGENLFACARDWDKLQKTAGALGAVPCRDALETAEQSDVVVAAVKPVVMEEALSPLRGRLQGKVLLSVAAGWDFSRLSDLVGPEVHCLCVAPNTPVSTGEGILLLEENHSLTPEEYEGVTAALRCLGTVETVSAAQRDIAGTISGCGPAFAAMFLEALGDAGVYHGLPRAAAYRLAAQMLAGTGKLYLETGEHPGAMKDAVCSPGGITIAGVAALERNSFRAAVMEAVDAAQNKRKKT